MTVHVQSPINATVAVFDPATVLPPASIDAEAPLRFAKAFSAEIARTVTARERGKVRPTEEVALFKSSGLVNLVIPEKFGGLGASLPTAYRVLIELSRGDASIGALLGYHFTNSGVGRLFDIEGDAEALDRESAAKRWFWGNVSQPLARTLKATPDDEGFRLDGVKYWNTGPSLADVTTVLAHRDDKPELVYAWLPTDRRGVSYRQDWDHLGLRRAETVTIDFDNVEVKSTEVFKSSYGPITSFPPLYLPIAELYFASYYLGAIYGALDAATHYIKTYGRPAPGSGVETATKDPYVLHLLGDFWVQAEAASAFFDKVAAEVQDGFERRRTINPRERAWLGVRTNAVRALVTKVGLDVTPRIYEVAGARATHNDFGFDRFWRDVRTHSLHDNQHYKLRAIGDFALNGEAREAPSFV